ncbi:hypothetical protein QYE77_14370 [Thermanaerothrix sp. 4228-RoL]|uniref:Transposase n=1 Tax=Thermanaerothrix solaris TaxID=3058434 RepID=A0ABU3NRJ1_9CHLR|nr:hypothetical protein [Thermanaerothrix sp. 4228-RoL]MDT8899446.1 hypothetical protein [Thermanaerothrix sp. 4228-RoL]
MGRSARNRLKPFLLEIVAVLEHHQELFLSAAVKSQLLRMSRSTIDRCLQPAWFEEKRHGLSTTKPGTLLKKAISIRTFADWDYARLGFVEVDLVAHYGQSLKGQFLNTLSTTDVSTVWTECVALLHRSQQLVFAPI